MEVILAFKRELSLIRLRLITYDVNHCLNCICCLVQELELLSLEDIQTNVYIKHPVQIEQYLMEGSYNKVYTYHRLQHLQFHYNVIEYFCLLHASDQY